MKKIMAKNQVVKLGYIFSSKMISGGFSEKILIDYLSGETEPYGRILLNLREYLVKYTKTFEKVYILPSEENKIFHNGTLKGVIANISRKEIDIAVQPFPNDELRANFVDFTYPFELLSGTFVTQMPEYKPEVQGIFRTFSLPLWISILLIFITLSLLYYISFKSNYSLDKISLHTFAVLLRQSSILKPSTMAERLLIYSWVVGSMLICLAYDSVFLSFLAFPPIFPIKDVSQLAESVINGDYHCITPSQSSYNYLLTISKEENLRVIGKDIQTNKLRSNQIWIDFLHGNLSQNLAFIVHESVVDTLSVGNKFVSEDRFLECMYAIMIRKDFCCKKVIDTFVHKMMASGLYFKYESDKSFLVRLPLLLKYQEKDITKRKLTLTDVAPAFIVLITGYFISFIVLMGEIWKHSRRKIHYMEKKKKRMTKILYEKDFVS